VSEAFSLAPVDARLAALFGTQAARIQRHRALHVAQGQIGARQVAVAATDPGMQHGAIGIEEGHALAALFKRARAAGHAVVLALDSAGARVDEDLAALGAFRALFRAALEARLAGVPMFALLGRNCFGGASLLACLCGQRSYLPQTLLSTSGPRVIEASEGTARFDARDVRVVRAHLGAAARIAWHEQDRDRPDTLDAASRAVQDWLTQSAHHMPDLARRQSTLEARLAACTDEANDDVKPRASLPESLLPSGYVPSFSGRLLQACPPETGTRKPVFLGALGGGPLGAAESAGLSRLLLGLRDKCPGSPIVLLLDASAHAASVHDESVLLSDFLVHLSLVISTLGHGGHRVALWILGQASGASYVAFSAPAHSVSAAVDARIEILPAAAREAIVGARGVRASGPDAWLSSGVADALLDERLRLEPQDSNCRQHGGPSA